MGSVEPKINMVPAWKRRSGLLYQSFRCRLYQSFRPLSLRTRRAKETSRPAMYKLTFLSVTLEEYVIPYGAYYFAGLNFRELLL